MHIRKAIQFFSEPSLHDPAHQSVVLAHNVYAYIKFYLRSSDLNSLRSTCREARTAITPEWVAHFRFMHHFPCDIAFLYSLHHAHDVCGLFNAELNKDATNYQISNDQLAFRSASLDGDTSKALACLQKLPSLETKYQCIRFALRGLPSCDAFYYDNSHALRDEIMAIIMATFTNQSGKLDLNIKDSDGYRIIHWLCLLADLVTLENLLAQHPTRVDDILRIQTDQGLSPIHFAVKSGNLAVVQALRKHNVDLNALNSANKTPIFIAASYGYAEIVKFFIQQDVNLYHVDRNFLTVIDAAINTGCVTSTRHLLNTGAFAADGLLCAAVSSGNIAMVKCILEYRPRLNLFSAYGLTPLLIAAREGYYGIAELLIQRGARVDITDKYGATPLHYAAANGRLETCKVLLRYNANITTLCHSPFCADRKPINAVQAALLNGHDEVHQMLDEKYQEYYKQHIAFTRWLR